MVEIKQRDINCPVCNCAINWKHTNVPGVLRGICPICGMGFIDNKGFIISDPKIS